jgi:O-antigen ligase
MSIARVREGALLVLFCSPLAWIPREGQAHAFFPLLVYMLGAMAFLVTAVRLHITIKTPLQRLGWLYVAITVFLTLGEAVSAERILAPGHLILGVLVALWYGASGIPIERVLRWMVLVGGVMVGIALLVQAMGLSTYDRLWAPAPNPGFLAAYMVGALPVALRMSRTRWRWVFYALAFAGVILLTGTRAGVGGALAGGLVLLLHPEGLVHFQRRSLLTGTLVVGLIALSLFAWRSPSLDLLAGDQARFAWWGEALEMFTERPFTGWGMWGFSEAGLVDPNGAPVDAPHNVYLQELMARGLLSVFSFSLLGLTLWRLWRTRTPEGAALSAALVGLGVYGLWWLPSLHMGLWLLIGMGYAMSQEQEGRR